MESHLSGNPTLKELNHSDKGDGSNILILLDFYFWLFFTKY